MYGLFQVREDEGLNKSGILKHVKDTVTKIRRVTEKLAKVKFYTHFMQIFTSTII